MVASDVETSVAANGVRENVLACTGGALDLKLSSNHPQHHYQEKRGRKDWSTLRKIANLVLTRVTHTEELQTPPTVEGRIMIFTMFYNDVL